MHALPFSRSLPTALVGLVALAGGVAHAHPALASAGTHSGARIYPCVAGLPASTICERALGVAIVPPQGWLLAPPGQYTPGSLDFTRQGRIRFSVQPLGAVDARHQPCAANAAAAALVRQSNSTAQIARTPITVGGVPAVELRGMPGPAPSVQIVAAANGALYNIVTFDSPTVQPDQRAALTSLRFIQRFRPFPNATPPAPAVVAAANTCAATPTTSRAMLDVQMSATTSAILVQVTGRGFRPNEAVSLRADWSGIPKGGQFPRYTRYTVMGTARASALGAIKVTLSIPVPAHAYAASTVHVQAESARRGVQSVATIGHLRNSTGMPDVVL